MSLLRIYCSLRETPLRCQWALVGDGRAPVVGEGPLAQLPQRAERVQLVLPAAEVLITRTRLPESARRRAGSVLAYAVEDETLGDPDANQVSWLGSAGEADVLAVADRRGLEAWHDALEAVGIRGYEVHCETLMLPWLPGEWSLAWNGREGFVRTSEFEGTASDRGDGVSPPMSLRLMIDEAKTLALVVDWTRLASEQRGLRTRMETRFRAAFPEAVAVVDPALQMRRKLAETRHAAGQPDSGDFLPMIVNVAAALKQLPPGKLRIASYESGRMTLELAGVDDTVVRSIVARLLQSGLQVDKGAEAATPARSGGATVVITVRST